MTTKQGYKAKLDQYFEKNIIVFLKDSRKISGKVVGYDEFMNLVLSNAYEQKEKEGVLIPLYTTMIRGNAIVKFQCLDRVDDNFLV